MNTSDIIKQENEYVVHSYGRVPVALEHGKNATAWDADGKEYIDFTSGIGVNAIGFCDEAWVEAVSNQAAKLQHISNYYYNENNTQLAQELSEATGLAKSFFCNSGAEANECAIKIARKHGEPKGAYKIITLNNSFHGRTITTLSATGQDVFHKDFLPLTDGFVYAEPNDLSSIEALVDDQACAVMIEMVQGEGGVLPMEEGFVKGLEKLCAEKEIVLIVDEVQTGVGRTGSFLASQAYDIKPDIVTLAKGLAGGLPIGVCMVNDKLKDILQPGMNGSTFGGNPVSCAAALEVVNRVNDEFFLRDVVGKGEYIKYELSKLPQIDFVRGKGLMLGIKLRDIAAGEVLVECAKRGLLILTAKDLVRFLPPLTITKEEIDKGLEIFKDVIDDLN